MNQKKLKPRHQQRQLYDVLTAAQQAPHTETSVSRRTRIKGRRLKELLAYALKHEFICHGSVAFLDWQVTPKGLEFLRIYDEMLWLLDKK
jgi:predicted transcriptional regulator